jgi:membrane protease subunit (stomatin/prohibitin family)
MPSKSVGFIKMEWTCPNCNSRNPGPVKTCQNCGAPQPTNVKFEMGSDQSFVKDEKETQQAQKGADIHCGFCGTRNPADAKTCSQCGGDLKEGMRREAGQLVERSAATAPQPVTCPNCGFKNQTSSNNCAQCGAPLGKKAVPPPLPATPAKPPSRKKIIGIAAAVIGFLAICCIAIFLFFMPTKSINATVDSVHWQTVAHVEEQQAVRHDDETGSVPSDAYDKSCHDKSEEVCEEKTIDKGNGYAEVVKDCHTETTTYCSYTVDEWRVVQSYTLEGNDLSPYWDNPSLSTDQRRGEDTATYTVYFASSTDNYTYNPSTLIEFQQYEIGSQWSLGLNTLGKIMDVKPVR